jgi:23S rRNA (adenine1618-N6)-methyltransferase
MKNNNTVKANLLHPRNLHSGRYDFKQLCAASAQLAPFVINNPSGQLTIDFANPAAVLALNQALLKCFYNISFWQIPAGYLCPPIPGRADYIHYLADLLAQSANGIVPTGKKVKVLDIGTGANCIYPIIGSQCYAWSFVATDIDPVSIKTAQLIVKSNRHLTPFIKLVLQKNTNAIFAGVIKKQDKFALTLCNPPFHASMEQAAAGNARKVNNLGKGKIIANPTLNFGGQENELCCAGGEIAFLKRMVLESQDYGQQVCWFTSLVSKAENIPVLKKLLTEIGVKRIKVINMSQGQKVSRLLAWCFLPEDDLTF